MRSTKGGGRTRPRLRFETPRLSARSPLSLRICVGEVFRSNTLVLQFSSARVSVEMRLKLDSTRLTHSNTSSGQNRADDVRDTESGINNLPTGKVKFRVAGIIIHSSIPSLAQLSG